tara:strand:+ start:308 stop:589 length:282 start_codon:yes stop_codon:yes gene_type:complete
MNGVRPIRSRAFKKKLMVKNANINEMPNANKRSREIEYSILEIVNISTTEIASIVGIDKRKLYLAEKFALYPKNNAVIIVTPDLEAPGIRAKL